MNREDGRKSVLVIGGGIAGIQASLDLANMGFRVYLVEKSPSIGGRMAQLDKTFPTNDCAMCILAPKMIEANSHPNIELLTYSEVEEVSGEVGKFRVRVRKKASFVDWSKCTGCGLCQEKCPWKVDSEFELGLGKRRVIYIPFAQAIPHVATIDKEHCVYLLKGKCGACEKVCNAKAIDFEQKDENIELKVGAIIIASGLDLYDITALTEYGYRRIKNVITALEFERLTAASGPTMGALQRPSDGKIPEDIAFIQCVGSRDFRNKAYCSSVCCMHATKEAMLAFEHRPGTKSTIFYMDMRAVGKRFQEYIARAKKEYEVTYVRGRPGRIEVNPENDNPIIWYEETVSGQVKCLETELVVLAQAMVPRITKEFVHILGIELSEDGFVKVPDKLAQPLDTTKSGIFACGYVHSPRDIPDSVTQASGAAGRAAEEIASLGSRGGK
jgi:heterodisulfide reductase subunit A